MLADLLLIAYGMVVGCFGMNIYLEWKDIRAARRAWRRLPKDCPAKRIWEGLNGPAP